MDGGGGTILHFVNMALLAFLSMVNQACIPVHVCDNQQLDVIDGGWYNL